MPRSRLSGVEIQQRRIEATIAYARENWRLGFPPRHPAWKADEPPIPLDEAAAKTLEWLAKGADSRARDFRAAGNDYRAEHHRKNAVFLRKCAEKLRES